MRAVARAKVNLTVRIIGSREDGYHELESVMQSLDLFDELSIAKSEETTVSFEWESSPAKIERPDLAERAVGAFNSGAAAPVALRMHVTKRIPPGSGLGGGSADAAAALLACDELAGRKLSAIELMQLGASVGADVPFAIQGGTAVVRGFGDHVSAMASPAEVWWVIGLTDVGLSTADVYRRFDEIGSPSGRTPKAGWDGLVKSLRNEDLVSVAAMLHNDLEQAAFDLMPSLAEAKSSLITAGALGAVMSGSGSAVCGMCADEDSANGLAARVAHDFSQVLVTRSAERGAQIVSM